jgi:hypothetical protein
MMSLSRVLSAEWGVPLTFKETLRSMLMSMSYAGLACAPH